MGHGKKRHLAVNSYTRPNTGGVQWTPLQTLARGESWRLSTMRSRERHCVVWVTRGSGQAVIEGRALRLGPGALLFIPAGRMHGFEFDAPMAGAMLLLPVQTPDPFPEDILALRVQSITDQGDVARIIDQIRAEATSGARMSDLAAEGLVTLLAVWLARHSQANAGPLDTGSEAATRLMRRFADLLDKGHREGLGVADYAARLGVTPTHLSRVCRQVAGRPASALVHDRLLYEARIMLEGSGLAVQEIAANLGFLSPSHFTRFFSQRMGCPPSAYRARMAARRSEPSLPREHRRLH